MSDFAYLSLLIILPLIGSAMIVLLPKSSTRMMALSTNILLLLVSLLMLSQFDTHNSQFQFVEKLAWIPTLNIHYYLGVDGISILFLPLTALLFCGVIIGSWTSVQTMTKLHYVLLLLLESATLGIFCALDTMLFFLFWEMTLIPIYFLVSLWGIGPNRRYAAVKYTLFMLTGGVPLLLAFVVLALASSNTESSIFVFDYVALLNNPLPAEAQTAVFFLLFLGFATKAPLFPFHTWLPTIAMEGPVSIAAIMTGLKLGAYGMIRFVVPLTPDASLEFHWLIAGLGVTGILYGAILALNQTNLRRMLAYSSISHVGLVVLGIASFNIQGIQGALFQLLNFSIVSGGLFLMTGFLHHRLGTTDSLSLQGVAHDMPLLAAFFFLFGLAAMGVPGTNGFIAEHLILLSSLQTHTGAGLAALAGIVLGAGYFLTIYRNTFLGMAQTQSGMTLGSLDLRPRELGIILLLSLLILYTGLFPSSILEITRGASEAWVARLGG